LFQQNHFFNWFGLHLIKGAGNYTHKTLRSVFENPEKIFSLTQSQLKTLLPRLDSRAIQNILKGPDLKKVHKHLEFCSTNGIQLIPIDSPLYPDRLKKISNPPPYLYVKGKWPISNTCIAVVGTRSPTQYGIKVTQKMVQGLVGHRFTIVSGMAKGIDTIAHKETLSCDGKTLAVLGRGLGAKSSLSESSLYKKLADCGTLVSELPIDKLADKTTFPLRNRIISALCLGTLIIEAGEKSGALITATYARQQKKFLFAFPGSVFNPKSRGTNNLIRGGAELVTHPDHIAQNLLPEVKIAKSLAPAFQIEKSTRTDSNIDTYPLKNRINEESLSKKEKEILNMLQGEMNFDQLRQVSGGAGAGLITILLTLESKGFIQRKPGEVYCHL